MISHRLPPTTTTHNQTLAPLKIANVTAAPSDKKSAGRRTPARLACLSQCALSYEHLLLHLFFHSTLRLESPRATIYQINTPPNLHNLPRPPTPSVPGSSNCEASQLPQERSKLPLPKAQRNCPVIVHSSTAHEGGGHRWKGGGVAVGGKDHVKFEALWCDSELCIKGSLASNFGRAVEAF